MVAVSESNAPQGFIAMPEVKKYLRPVATAWSNVSQAVFNPRIDERELEGLLREARARQQIPVLWLLGRAQSGKSTIVRALTGSPRADIGSGYRACTRTASLYDYPAAMPLVRFLDTRGLGEVDYDPAEDIAFCEGQSHLIVATVRAMEPAEGPVLDVLRVIRARHPDWALVVAQTCLHEGYPPGVGHVLPYPFAAGRLPDAVPADLRRALAAQRQAFEALPGRLSAVCVPIDLTPVEEGFEPADYGLEALWQAIEQVLPYSLRPLLTADPAVKDLVMRRAEVHIRGYAIAATALGAVPAAGAVGVPALQGKLVHSLASLYGLDFDRRLGAEFLLALGLGVGSGFLARYAGRELFKLLPGFGQTIGAAWGATASGACTYALGRSACVYFDEVRGGGGVDVDAVRRAYADAFASAGDFLSRREDHG
jgi:uncharacterized protein (DUF697 family)